MSARNAERAQARAAQQFNANRGEQRDRVRRGLFGSSARLEVEAARMTAIIGSIGTVSPSMLERLHAHG